MTRRYIHRFFISSLLLAAAGTASATCTGMITPPDGSGITMGFSCASVNQSSPAATGDVTVASGSDITVVAGVWQVSDPMTSGLPNGWEGGAQMNFIVDGKVVSTVYAGGSYPQYATYVVKGLANGKHQVHATSYDATTGYQTSPDINVYVGTAQPAALNGAMSPILEYTLDN